MVFSFLPISGNQSQGSGSLQDRGVEDSESQVSVWIGHLDPKPEPGQVCLPRALLGVTRNLWQAIIAP